MEKQIYSYDEAYEESLRYFQGDELAARVWVNKYAVKDSFGNIYEKSPEDMHWRIANEVARVPLNTKESSISRCFASVNEAREFLKDSYLFVNFSSILLYILQQQLIFTGVQIYQIYRI